MIVLLVRSFKRLLILAVGLAVVYLAVWEFFPFFDNRVPLALALLATYVFTAYFFIPALIRVFRLFVRPNHIPLYCVTPDGFASDPINIGIIGTRVEIIEAMRKSGWYRADKRNLKSMARLGMAILLRRSYPTAPFSNLYLLGRKQDLGFQLPIDGSASNRHHVRFWACQVRGPEDFQEHVHFWRRFHRRMQSKDNRQFWIGAASRDVGIIPIRHTGQMTHMIDPDTNAERDLIVRDLRRSGYVTKTRTITVGAPYQLRNRTLGGFLHTDGKMRVCILKY
jgi:hypothetical protein